MSHPQEPKITKSKKWIDYSSEEENDHHDDEPKTNGNHQETNPKATEQKDNKKEETKTDQRPSTSNEPANKHQSRNNNSALQELRRIKGNLVWLVLSAEDQKHSDTLKNSIENLKSQKNARIVSIYPSRESSNAWDIRVEYELAEKWIVEGFNKKGGVKVQVKKRVERKEQKYEERDREYRPARQYAGQQATSSKYEPKNTQYRQKEYRSPNRYEPKDTYYEKKSSQYNTKEYSSKPQEKKKYVEKNPLAEELEQKVEEELKERKMNKKENKKTTAPTSKIFSKNPFDAFNDSD